jgi:mannonate dehydratase
MERADEYPVDVSEAELWENLQHFLDEVVPVAEEAGVDMALHPDDPPLSPIRGVPRLVTSVEHYDRILEMYDSPNHGVTFCQGNFAAMGADIPGAIRRFGDRIHFVHFRDVDGEADSFVETWHDDGPTDMRAAMDAYRDVGFDGPIRPDHVPKMLEEDDRDEAMSGYTDMGRLFAVGYIRGLLES